ncbi:MAG: hypothetical protein AAGG01_19490, partial [Planctomycetota bacterium]
IGLVHVLDAEGNRRLRDSAITLNVEPNGASADPVAIHVNLDELELPHDLGTIRVERGITFDLEVMDEQGQPIQGAKASFQKRSEDGSDEMGRLALQLDEAQDIVVEATGFLSSTLPSADLLQGDARMSDAPIRVVLARSHAVELRVLGWEAGTSKRSRPRRIIRFSPRDLLDHRDTERLSEDEISELRNEIQRRIGRLQPVRGSVTSASQPDVPWRLRAACSDEPLTFGPLVPGVKVSVGVMDTFGNMLMEREVEVDAEPGTQVVTLDLAPFQENTATVEVVDETGAFLQDSSVMPWTDGVGGSNDRTLDGVLRYAPVAPGPFRLFASGEGVLDEEAAGVIAPGGHALIRVVLRRARTLRVAVLDDRGESVDVTTLVLETPDGERNHGDREEGDSEYVVEHVPVGDVTAEVTIGTRTLRIPIGPGDGPHRIFVPGFGSLQAVLPAPLSREGEWAELRISLAELDDPTKTLELRESVAPDASGELRLSGVLLPGRYRIEAVWIDEIGDDEDAYPRTTLHGGEVEIQPHEVTRIDLAP